MRKKRNQSMKMQAKSTKKKEDKKQRKISREKLF